MATSQDSPPSGQEGREANTQGWELREHVKWIGTLQNSPCSEGALYRQYANQTRYTTYGGHAGPSATGGRMGVGTPQDSPCSVGALYRQHANQPQSAAPEEYAGPLAQLRSTCYLADSRSPGDSIS